MKVKLIDVPSLYPDFTPYVTKYGDNGGVYSKTELKKYLIITSLIQQIIGWII